MRRHKPILSFLLFCLALRGVVVAPRVAAFPLQTTREKALIAAVDKQDLARVNELLAAGANPNANDSTSLSVLVHAVSKGSIPITEVLLKKGAIIDGAPGTKVNPLPIAVSKRHPDLVKFLLDHGAKTDVPVTGLKSALQMAAETGQIEVMKMLLAHGAQVQRDKEDYRFPLAGAAATGQKAAVELLLAHGAQVDAVTSEGQSALMLAATDGNLEMLIAHGASLNLLNKDGESTLDLADGPQKANIVAALRKAGLKDPMPTLFTAIKKNDTRVLRELLENGADPNTPDADGRTPIFYAQSALDSIALKLLLSKGADPNVRDKKGATPLSVAREDNNVGSADVLLAAGAYSPDLELVGAIEENDIKTVTALLDAKVDPNSTDIGGETALGIACTSGNGELIRLLVSRGANINAPDKEQMTPLLLALRSGHMPEARFLLEKGADAAAITEDGTNALIAMAGQGSVEMVRLLMEHGASVQSKDKLFSRSVLQLLVPSADVAVLQYLIEHGAAVDINRKDGEGINPLAAAALSARAKVVELLLAKGANPNSVDEEGRTPLHFAIYGIVKARKESEFTEPPVDREEDAERAVTPNPPPTAAQIQERIQESNAVLRLLIKQGAKIEARDKAGLTPMEVALRADCPEAVTVLQQAGAHKPGPTSPKTLLAAAADNDQATLKRLLANGANPNTADEDGFSPLMTSAMRGNFEMVQALLNHGAKPDFRGATKSQYVPPTALFQAAQQGHNEIVRLLLKRGASPNPPGNAERSALNEVIGQGQWEAVRILVAAGTDVNTGEKTGMSPLERAAVMSNVGEIVRLLLAKGAHVSGKFAGGITPLMAAANGGNVENITLLLKAGSDVKVQRDGGDSVLMMAVESGSLEAVRTVMQALLAAHGDINATNEKNQTALSIALDSNMDAIARLLKESGAK